MTRIWWSIAILTMHIQTLRYTPHQMDIKPSFFPPRLLSLKTTIPTIGIPPGPLQTSKTTHEDQYLYSVYQKEWYSQIFFFFFNETCS